MPAVYNWAFKYGPSSTTFTTDVLSWSCFLGRQNFQDQYSGNRFQITIKNQNNQAANFTRGTQVIVLNDLGGNFLGGKVNRVDYNDYPGNIGLSTATLICDDAVAQAGRFYLEAFTGYNTSEATTAQAVRTNFSYTGFNSPPVVTYGTGGSTASATASYNGTMLNRLNLLQRTEQGQIWTGYDAVNGDKVLFLSRSQISNLSTVSLTRTTDGISSIKYTDLRRIQAGDNFMNYVTVNPDALAVQTASNTTSITAYGRAGYQINTVDATTTQAANNASWLANSQGDPAVFRFEIDFDSATSPNGIYSFITELVFYRNVTNQLTYRVPGAGSDTTIPVVIEGLSVSGTPTVSRFTAYASPATYYQFFTLNSSTYGILNTSRLGW